MELTLALAGDTMLGREVAERLRSGPPEALVAPEVVAVAAEAELFALNLECCVSTRGEQVIDPEKEFFFRAPPQATALLQALGVDCVTLANNHALDYGPDALADTFEHLGAAGIPWVGAGLDEERARAPAILTARSGFRLAVLGVTDDPPGFAAAPGRPGVAYAPPGPDLPPWLRSAVGSAAQEADAVLVTPHWGPNMARRPSPDARAAGAALVRAGATLVAGHSAHLVHGVEGRVLYDLGGFLDDYRRDRIRRNDLGLLWHVTLGEHGPRRLEAVPLKLGSCRTTLAAGRDARWLRRRFRTACATYGTAVSEEDGRLVVTWDAPSHG
jgi:poly-gamma-glutamate synthesis protein (capsule biosynthesis protein)